ncbi:major facilitator superfamily domain-containing protein [Mucor lusitanicus]|uniref:Major facilitator superfamily domain-containing protein n=1 Tax=Mucor circinelloides f. lusitanicus TaxID=29924 RepID=A0A8H4F5V8_MUCCL|nr:major facilitator superfamily domain-containing protein [Mucor lusitanicus]
MSTTTTTTTTPDTHSTPLKGVKTVEFYKAVWNKWDRYILFVGLMPTVLYILQTALLPIYSKLSDMYGRAQCYTFALVFYIVSNIVMATANNYNTLVGGQVIYAFGYTGASILGPITIADLTNVVDRGLMQGLYNIPGIVNLFVAPRVGDALFDAGHWRVAYGLIPVILLVTSLPLIGNMWKLNYQVNRSGLMDEFKTEQKKLKVEENLSVWQIIARFMTEIDLVGSILLVAGLCLILLPLVLALPSWGGWTSPTTLATLCSGVIAWVLFAAWEIKCAAKPIIPLAKWETRTPIYGVLALSTVTIISSVNWQFFTTYLMVSRKFSASTAIMIGRGYNIAYIVCEVLVGYLMKRFRVWRPFVWSGVALTMLGVGLMIPARQPSSSAAFLVISQTIAGMGSGFLYTPMLVAIQSSVPHSDVAIATAMMQVGGSIAASIGSTTAGTIWNNMIPSRLAKYVPGDYDYAKIVGSIPYAISLPTEQYNGVVEAYSSIQKILSIIAICIAVLTFCFTIPMKSFGLESYDADKNQNDGDNDSAGSDQASSSSDIEKPEAYGVEDVDKRSSQ